MVLFVVFRGSILLRELPMVVKKYRMLKKTKDQLWPITRPRIKCFSWQMMIKTLVCRKTKLCWQLKIRLGLIFNLNLQIVELDAHSMEMSTSNESVTFAHPISDLSMGMSTSNESATFAHPISNLMLRTADPLPQSGDPPQSG